MKSTKKKSTARKPMDTLPLYTRVPRDIHILMGTLAEEQQMTLAMFARLTLVNAIRVKRESKSA